MPVIFVHDPVGWNVEFETPQGMVGRDLARRGAIVQRRAQRQVGKRTGRLRSSIKSEVSRDGRGLKVRIGSSHRIALLHHNGTKPHEIRARRPGRMLRFVQNGRVRYAYRVWHPGTKPNRYLTDNLPWAAR